MTDLTHLETLLREAKGLSELFEVVAQSDAAFDGRPWNSMGREDQKRYINRAALGIVALITALKAKEAGNV